MRTRTFVAALLIASLALPAVSSAASMADIRAQLEDLLTQIGATKAALTASASSALSDDYGTGESGGYCPNLRSTFQRNATDARTGNQVTELQRFLADRYDLDESVAISGFFGKTPQRYVVQFQSEQGLPALGIVGGLTRAAIARTCSQASAPTIPTNTSCGNGNDYYDGGDGIDTLTYTGKRSDFVITKNGNGSINVHDTVPCRAGTDTVVNVENFAFADGTYSFAQLFPASVTTDWPSLGYSILVKGSNDGDTWQYGTDINGINFVINNSSAGIQKITFPTNCWYTYKIYNKLTNQLVFDLGATQQCMVPGTAPATTFTLAQKESKFLEFAHKASTYTLPPGSYVLKVTVLSTFTLTDAALFNFNVAGNTPTCTITSTTPYSNTPPYGQIPVTLSWTSTNASSATITPYLPGPLRYEAAFAVASNGSTVVNPIDTTNYTLTVSGPGGFANCMTQVGLKG